MDIYLHILKTSFVYRELRVYPCPDSASHISVVPSRREMLLPEHRGKRNIKRGAQGTHINLKTHAIRERSRAQYAVKSIVSNNPPM